jgi:hypothetical protein
MLFMFHVSCFMLYVSCFIFHFSCLMFHVSCFMFHVSCFMFHVSCFMFHVSCFMFHVPCFMFHVSYVMFRFSLFMSSIGHSERSSASIHSQYVPMTSLIRSHALQIHKRRRFRIKSRTDSAVQSSVDASSWLESEYSIHR